MLFIIFGTRGIASTKASGTFYCPKCAAQRPYRFKAARRFFTLYSVPIVPLDALGDFVECAECGATYRREILQYDPEEESRQLEAEYHRAIRQIMVHMMLADGQVQENEIETIRSIYKQLSGSDLAPDDVRDEAVTLAYSNTSILDGLTGYAGLLNDQGKEMVIRAAFYIATADGDLAAQELDFLSRVGQTLQMSPARIRAVLSEVIGAYPVKPGRA